MRTFILNGNATMPVLGSGTNTFGKLENSYYGEITGDTTPLESAIKIGYRLFDTAIAYRNEAVVGKAIAESKIDRKEFFITTKIEGKPEFISSRERIIQTVEQSLINLKTDYIDLVLIHKPWDDLNDVIRVWKVLEELVKEGKIISLGVSNFNVSQLDYLINRVAMKPCVLQFESHPGKWQKDLIEYCSEKGIVPQAWSSLSAVSHHDVDLLVAIGNKYGKAWPQVVLNYQLSLGMAVIPKSHNPKHQEENFNVFDFELSADDLRVISEL